MMKKNLIILAAPSGTGKTSICKELLKRNKDWQFSISATTREPRPGEVDGVDYNFLDSSKFEHYIKFGDFLEWEFVHGNKYGTLINPLEETIQKNKVMILDVDVKGGETIMEEFPEESLSIFIEPPGDDIPEQIDILTERLTKRGDISTFINQRLKRFQLEIEYKEKFNYSFINKDMLKTTDAIEKLIKENIK
tara:strand:- start:31 stop:609 length:579 start_codon:yes stop_codon:yes gene_type:complete